MPLPIFELTDHVRERVDRVRRDSAVGSRVEVNGGALGVQLDVEQTAECCSDCRMPVLVHAAVPDQDRVGLQLFALLAQEGG